MTAIYRNLISPIASTLFLILSFRLKIFVDYFKVPLLWKCLVHSLLIQNQVNWKKQGQTITQITHQYLTMPWKIKAGYLDILLKSMCNCSLRARIFVVWFGKVWGFHFCAFTRYRDWYQEGHSCKSALGYTHEAISHVQQQIGKGCLLMVTGWESGGVCCVLRLAGALL